MSSAKQEDILFDPKAPAYRYRLWVRLKTPEGSEILILWRKVLLLLGVLAITGWLALAGTLWGFVKYQRGVADVRFVDIAFYPLRRAEYRATLARHHLATAKTQIEKQAWPEALLSLRVALGNVPQNLEARLLLADLYLLYRRPEQSRQVLEDGLPYAGQDTAYLRRTLNLLRAQRQYERILAFSRHALPAQPDTTSAHLVIAWQTAQACKELKRYDEATAVLERWRLDTVPEGQALLAEIAIARGEPEIAIARLNQQLALRPENELISIQLTKIYLKLGRMDEARRTALMRSFAHPESPGARIDLMNIEWQANDRQAFDKSTDEFIASFSYDVNALILLGVLAAEKAQPTLTARLLAVVRGTPAPLAPFLFAQMHAQCAAQNYIEALATAAELDRMEAMPPRVAGALLSLKAWASFGLKNDTEGQIWLQRFLTQPQVNPTDGLRLAAALSRLGQPAVQLHILVTLADRQPPADEAVVALLEYYAQQNAWKEAGDRLPQLLAVANPPAELVQTIQWHLKQDETDTTGLP